MPLPDSWQVGLAINLSAITVFIKVTFVYLTAEVPKVTVSSVMLQLPEIVSWVMDELK